MKKLMLIPFTALLMLSACNGNKSNETEQEKKQEVQPIEKETPVENSMKDQEDKEARRLDSLRQIKEHGHAH